MRSGDPQAEWICMNVLPSALPWLAVAVLAMASCNDGSANAEAPVARQSTSHQQAGSASLLRGHDFVWTGEATQGGWLRGLAPLDAVSVTFNGVSVPFGDDGAFFVAFDRDSAPEAQITAVLSDGSTLSPPLIVRPRAWKIEHVAVGPRPGAIPSEEYQRRRAIELQQINAARNINAPSEGWRQRFVWPVKGRISGLFGSQRIYRGTPGGYHSGTDIATGENGTPFVAPADGVVILAADNPFTLEGHLLMIDHGNGLNSAFLHCSQIIVKVGDNVRQGQVIGRLGMSGRATGPHLHWSMKWRSARLDPILFAGPMTP